ncbi:hypothetical protein GQ600_13163 [Phytophthora cactorum]|nr:hypothetical protein GQ600_13163 [Phytophthora cactorum]
MQTNTETSQQISNSVLKLLTGMLCTKLNIQHCGGISRESRRRQIEFPKVSLTIAWESWWLSSPSTNAPPYRSLVPIDLPTIRARKRLSDFRYVMIKFKISLADNKLTSITHRFCKRDKCERSHERVANTRPDAAYLHQT